ncbi:MAG: hypothetical protein V1926_02605 [Candidatus Peregrinibacteria bacterium]
MIIELSTRRDATRGETQHCSGSLLERQITDVRNRLRNVSRDRLQSVCQHFGLQVNEDASQGTMQETIAAYFEHPTKNHHRGKILALLNKPA